MATFKRSTRWLRDSGGLSLCLALSTCEVLKRMTAAETPVLSKCSGSEVPGLTLPSVG